MIKLLVLTGLACGVCAIIPPVGPQAGRNAQVILGKPNDSKLDEKPRFGAPVKSAVAPAPGRAPPPAPAPAPAPAPVQAPLPPVVTQAPPPPALPPVPKPKLTPEFLQLFQAAFAPTTAPTVATVPPTAPSPFAQMFQTMPGMSMGMPQMFRPRATMPGMFGQSYFPTTASYFYNRRRPQMCFGECKTELCDWPERERPGFCPGGGRKIKRCCSWL